MKLKFSEECKEVIAKLRALPESATSSANYVEPMRIIREFDKKLKAEKVKGKQWAKNRRELSFLYQLIVSLGNNDLRFNAETYSNFLTFISDMESGKLLKSTPFIRIALSYGILRLSDHEIEQLIKNNKV